MPPKNNNSTGSNLPARRDRTSSSTSPSSSSTGNGKNSNNIVVRGSNMQTGMHPFFALHGVQPPQQQQRQQGAQSNSVNLVDVTDNNNNNHGAQMNIDDIMGLGLQGFMGNNANSSGSTSSARGGSVAALGHGQVMGKMPPPPPPPPGVGPARRPAPKPGSKSASNNNNHLFGFNPPSQQSNASSSSSFGAANNNNNNNTTSNFIRHQMNQGGGGGGGGDDDGNVAHGDDGSGVESAEIKGTEGPKLREHFVNIILSRIVFEASCFRLNGELGETQELINSMHTVRSRAHREAEARLREKNPLLLLGAQQQQQQQHQHHQPGAGPASAALSQASSVNGAWMNGPMMAMMGSFRGDDDNNNNNGGGAVVAPLILTDAVTEDINNSNMRNPQAVELDILKLVSAAPSLATPLAQRTESALKAIASEIAAACEHITHGLYEHLVLCYMRGPDLARSMGPKHDDGAAIYNGALLQWWLTREFDLNEQLRKWHEHREQLYQSIELLRAKHGGANDGVIEGGGGRGGSAAATSRAHSAAAVSVTGSAIDRGLVHADIRVQRQLENELQAMEERGAPSTVPFDPLDLPGILVRMQPFRRAQNICLRPTHCPPCFTVAAHDLSFSRHNGKLVQIRGTVIKNTSVRLVVYKATFECPKCHATKDCFSALATRQQAVTRPSCSNCKKDRTKMSLLSEYYKDYCECWLQRQSFGDDASLDDDALFGVDDSADQLGGAITGKSSNSSSSNNQPQSFSAKLPRSILVALEDDLTRAVYPGLTVQVAGVCVARWNNTLQGQAPEVTLLVNALEVQVVSAAALAQNNPSSISARQQAVLMMARRYMKQSALMQAKAAITASAHNHNSSNNSSSPNGVAVGGGGGGGGGETQRMQEQHERLLLLHQRQQANDIVSCENFPIAFLLQRLESVIETEEDTFYAPDGVTIEPETNMMTQSINNFIDINFARDPNMQTPEMCSIRDERAGERTGENAEYDAFVGGTSKLLISRELLRAKLVQSVAPQLCGRFVERLAVLLTCVGGVRRRAGGGGNGNGSGGSNHHHPHHQPYGVLTAEGSSEDGGGTTTTQSSHKHHDPVHNNNNNNNSGGGGGGGVSSRSNIHLLFVGDPSTGKSQLLLASNQIAVTGVYALGIGTTSAGLTAAASKESGEWTLEPGALVLSNGGVCVIDELRTVSAADRNSLHEAMEQQSISVAKAGMCATLRTDCSVIAACNPVSRGGRRGQKTIYDPTQNRDVEIGIGAPLLSRFDLVFTMFDSTRHDDVIARHILALNTVSDELLGIVDNSNNSNSNNNEPTNVAECVADAGAKLGSGQAAFTTAQLRAFAALCRMRCHLKDTRVFNLGGGAGAVAAAAATGTSTLPTQATTFDPTNNGGGYGTRNLQDDLALDDGAADLIHAYYKLQKHRSETEGIGSSTLSDHMLVTIRFLESIVRLTQAHAALLGRATTCTRQDAAMAVFLTEQSARTMKLTLFPEVLGDDARFGNGCDPRLLKYNSDLRAAKTEDEREALLSYWVQNEGLDLRGQVMITVPYSCSNADRWFLNVGRAYEWAQRMILETLANCVFRECEKKLGGSGTNQQQQQQLRQSISQHHQHHHLSLSRPQQHRQVSAAAAGFGMTHSQANAMMMMHANQYDNDDDDAENGGGSNEYGDLNNVFTTLQAGKEQQQRDEERAVLEQLGATLQRRSNRDQRHSAPGGYRETVICSHMASVVPTQMSFTGNNNSNKDGASSWNAAHTNIGHHGGGTGAMESHRPSPTPQQLSQQQQQQQQRSAAGLTPMMSERLARERNAVLLPCGMSDDEKNKDAETRHRVNDAAVRGLYGGSNSGSSSGGCESPTMMLFVSASQELQQPKNNKGTASGSSTSAGGVDKALAMFDLFKHDAKTALSDDLKKRSSGDLQPQ